MNEFARITSFVRSMAKEDAGALGELYRDAVKRGVPVIRPEARELLKTQLLLKKPKRVLEIGTAVGYSSIYMTGFADHNAGIERGTDCGSKNKCQTAWKRDADSGDLWRCGRDVEGASR